MSRKFSTREKILLLILAVLLILSTYYTLVDQPVRTTLQDAQSRMSAAEAELNIQMVRLEKMRQMQQALDQRDPNAQADVPDFDNAQAVVTLMNNAMAQTQEYTLSFQSVAYNGAIASRSIDMDFICDDYDSAKQILKTLLDSPYRCRITSLNVASSDGASVCTEPVQVRASVTFYEYLAPEQRKTENS